MDLLELDSTSGGGDGAGSAGVGLVGIASISPDICEIEVSNGVLSFERERQR
jgi:hypothetical protein